MHMNEWVNLTPWQKGSREVCVCHPIHEKSVIESRKVLWVREWWWDLPIVESISRSRPGDLRMTESFFRPCSLLELTWTWSGPRAWQYKYTKIYFFTCVNIHFSPYNLWMAIWSNVMLFFWNQSFFGTPCRMILHNIRWVFNIPF